MDVLRGMMKWENEDVFDLAQELISTGLATENSYGHISLDPALCPYLREQLNAATQTKPNQKQVPANLQAAVIPAGIAGIQLPGMATSDNPNDSIETTSETIKNESSHPCDLDSGNPCRNDVEESAQ